MGQSSGVQEMVVGAEVRLKHGGFAYHYVMRSGRRAGAVRTEVRSEVDQDTRGSGGSSGRNLTAETTKDAGLPLKAHARRELAGCESDSRQNSESLEGWSPPVRSLVSCSSFLATTSRYIHVSQYSSPTFRCIVRPSSSTPTPLSYPSNRYVGRERTLSKFRRGVVGGTVIMGNIMERAGFMERELLDNLRMVPVRMVWWKVQQGTRWLREGLEGWRQVEGGARPGAARMLNRRTEC